MIIKEEKLEIYHKWKLNQANTTSSLRSWILILEWNILKIQEGRSQREAEVKANKEKSVESIYMGGAKGSEKNDLRDTVIFNLHF